MKRGIVGENIMASMPPELNRIGHAALLLPTQADRVAGLADELQSFLEAQGVSTETIKANDEGADSPSVGASDTDLLIALGGDGTMLRAGSIGADASVPILGINLGRVGFLIEVQRSQWRTALERVLSGDCWIERRMRLGVSLRREGDVIGEWQALNECAVDRGRASRPVRLRAEIDDRRLTTYVADGLICATATGSTGYALAAGGPILPPEARDLLLVPVAPHLSMDRAIVLPEDTRVAITVEEPIDAHVHVDGRVSRPLASGDRIEMRAGDKDVYFVRLQDRGYFFRNLTAHLNSGEKKGQAE